MIDLLGAGGMAEVFKARATGSAGFQRDVVLKRVHAAHDGDPELVKMFTDEARLLGFLHHPNVVQALDFYQEGDQLFLVLEYVDGPSLSRVLRDGRDTPPAIVAYVGREICRALDYIHELRAADGTPLGVIHRDVTPSNIMVTPTGAVKLLDFGVAKFANAAHITRGGIVMGKPAYLAPEQLQTEEAIDGRVDLFALGIVLHELLTGAHLFRGENDLGTLKQIMEKQIAPPSCKRAGVPRELDRIVMRALERDPSRRYQSAAAMGRDLDGVVQASHLRVEEVAAFVRGIGAPAAAVTRVPDPRAARAGRARIEEDEAPTRRDLRLPLRVWMDARPGGLRRVLVAALGLALGMGTLGVGHKLLTARAPLSESVRSPARECPPPASGEVRASLVSTAMPAAAAPF